MPFASMPSYKTAGRPLAVPQDPDINCIRFSSARAKYTAAVWAAGPELFQNTISKSPIKYMPFTIAKGALTIEPTQQLHQA